MCIFLAIVDALTVGWAAGLQKCFLFPSDGQHLNYDDCLEDKKED